MGQITISRLDSRISKLSKREQLVVLEIAGDAIDSASIFVDYIGEAYGFSKSSVWYVLNRLKEKGVIDFASKEEQGKALTLTRGGLQDFKALEKQGVKLDIFAPNDPVDWPTDPEYMIGRNIALTAF